MNNLQTTLNTRKQQLGYDQFPGFYHSAKIVFHHEGKNRMHTFNYLWQEYALEKYLELNNLCMEFNDAFDHEKKDMITDDQTEWLESHDFLPVIDNEFTNEQLRIDFYPRLKWYPVKDKAGNHYLLVSIQWYNSQKFSWFKMFKYFQPAFSFSMPEFYIEKWM